MKESIKQMIGDLGLTRIARIKLLTELLNEEINEAVKPQIPEYAMALLLPENFPCNSKVFKSQLMEAMPPMKSVEGMRRKSVRIIADLRDMLTITSVGNGSATVYHLTE